MTVNIIHDTCGGTAFQYDHPPHIGEPFPMAEHCVGQDVKNGDPIICGTCGEVAYGLIRYEEAS